MSVIKDRAAFLLRDRLGIPGLLAIVALVFAMVGGAWAAKGGGLTAKQKKQVTKIAKKYAGKPGAPGAAGPTGAPGANGKDGAPGANGKDGAPGTNGKSVVTGTATPAECPGSNPSGGATVEVQGEPATEKKICNGKEGSPWTVDGILPEGESVKGAWAGFASLGSKQIWTPISFTIPLSEPLEGSEVHFFEEADFATTCTGSTENPTAPAGHLCVYGAANAIEAGAFGAIHKPSSLSGLPTPGADKSGAVMHLVLKEDVPGIEQGFAGGTWAVTAPEE
jgi:hypothetical protein